MARRAKIFSSLRATFFTARGIRLSRRFSSPPRRWIFISGAGSRKSNAPIRARSGSSISVAVNLSMLGFFKYGNFLLENFQWALARGGITYQPPHLDVFLPIGISFYTFHSLSYTLDIYRGVMQPTQVAARFCARRFVFPAAGRGADCARGRFPAAARGTAETADRPFRLGPAPDDARSLRKSGARRHDAGRLRGPGLRLWRTACRAGFVDRCHGLRGPDLFRLCRLFHLRDRRGACALAFTSRTTFAFPMPRSAFRISGGAGTSRFPLSCATTFTFRWEETAPGPRAR